MRQSSNLIHKIKERAVQTGKTGKYILTMLPFLYQTLNPGEVKSMNTTDFQPKMIEMTATKMKDSIPDEPVSVKEITLKPEYIAKAKDFFAVMHEYLNGSIDDIDMLNQRRKALNKDISVTHNITEDGVKAGRFRVTSFFEKGKNGVVLKNISDITKGQASYTVEAKVKSFVYEDEQTLLFETDEKEYDFNIILHQNGDVSIVSKNGKAKTLKLNNKDDVYKFDTFLKETFPPAYITFRDQSVQDLQDKGEL